MKLIGAAQRLLQKNAIKRISLSERKNHILALQAREEIKKMIRFGNVPVVMV